MLFILYWKPIAAGIAAALALGITTDQIWRDVHDDPNDSLRVNIVSGAPMGPKGDTGDTGPIGPQGDMGDPGLDGADGVGDTSPACTVGTFFTATLPTGWLLLDGSAYDPAVWPDLDACLDAAFSGPNTLPDFRDQFVRGSAAPGTATSGSDTHNHGGVTENNNQTQAGTGGLPLGTLADNPHDHDITGDDNIPSHWAVVFGIKATDDPTGPPGGFHDNLTDNRIVRADGTDDVQDSLVSISDTGDMSPVGAAQTLGGVTPWLSLRIPGATMASSAGNTTHTFDAVDARRTVDVVNLGTGGVAHRADITVGTGNEQRLLLAQSGGSALSPSFVWAPPLWSAVIADRQTAGLALGTLTDPVAIAPNGKRQWQFQTSGASDFYGSTTVNDSTSEPLLRIAAHSATEGGPRITGTYTGASTLAVPLIMQGIAAPGWSRGAVRIQAVGGTINSPTGAPATSRIVDFSVYNGAHVDKAWIEQDGSFRGANVTPMSASTYDVGTSLLPWDEIHGDEVITPLATITGTRGMSIDGAADSNSGNPNISGAIMGFGGSSKTYLFSPSVTEGIIIKAHGTTGPGALTLDGTTFLNTGGTPLKWRHGTTNNPITFIDHASGSNTGMWRPGTTNANAASYDLGVSAARTATHRLMRFRNSAGVSDTTSNGVWSLLANGTVIQAGDLDFASLGGSILGADDGEFDGDVTADRFVSSRTDNTAASSLSLTRTVNLTGGPSSNRTQVTSKVLTVNGTETLLSGWGRENHGTTINGTFTGGSFSDVTDAMILAGSLTGDSMREYRNTVVSGSATTLTDRRTLLTLNGGSLTSWTGHNVRFGLNSGTVGTLYGLQVTRTAGTTQATNVYGLHIDTSALTPSGVHRGIHVAGNVESYFGGDVIGARDVLLSATSELQFGQGGADPMLKRGGFETLYVRASPADTGFGRLEAVHISPNNVAFRTRTTGGTEADLIKYDTGDQIRLGNSVPIIMSTQFGTPSSTPGSLNNSWWIEGTAPVLIRTRPGAVTQTILQVDHATGDQTLRGDLLFGGVGNIGDGGSNNPTDIYADGSVIWNGATRIQERPANPGRLQVVNGAGVHQPFHASDFHMTGSLIAEIHAQKQTIAAGATGTGGWRVTTAPAGSNVSGLDLRSTWTDGLIHSSLQSSVTNTSSGAGSSHMRAVTDGIEKLLILLDGTIDTDADLLFSGNGSIGDGGSNNPDDIDMDGDLTVGGVASLGTTPATAGGVLRLPTGNAVYARDHDNTANKIILSSGNSATLGDYASFGDVDFALLPADVNIGSPSNSNIRLTVAAETVAPALAVRRGLDASWGHLLALDVIQVNGGLFRAEEPATGATNSAALGNTVLAAPRGTGNAAPTDLVLSTADAAASGTTRQTLVEALRIHGESQDVEVVTGDLDVTAGDYYHAATQGLTATATMTDAAGTGTCTITFSGGIATATTC